MRLGFPYEERWILKTAGTGVQNIEDLLMNSLFNKQKLVFGVR
jgi:hypothetical protein